MKQAQFCFKVDSGSFSEINTGPMPSTNLSTNKHSKLPGKAKRPSGVPLQIYWKFIKAGSTCLWVISFFLTIIAQGLNTFSYWWIGAARNPKYHFAPNEVTGIYIGVVLGYGTLLFISTIVLPYISFRAAEGISHEIISTVATVDLSWIDKQNKAFSAGILGRVSRQ